MDKTINQIKFELKEIADKHKSINSFYFGNFADAINSSEAVKYPLMVVTLVPGSMGEKFVSTRIALTICDKYEKDNIEQLDNVYSDTQQIQADIKNIFRSYRFEDYMTPSEVQLQPFEERGSDFVAGWIGNFEIRSFDNGNYCIIPIDDYDFENSPFINCETGIAPPPPGCDDARVTNSNQSYDEDVASGGTLILPDVNINANGNLLETIPSVENYDVTVLDQDNAPTGTVETYLGNQIIRVSSASSGIAYNYPTPPITYASYQTGDAAWRVANGDFNYPNQNGKIARLVNFTTLAENNIHGNTERFTDPSGGQDFDPLTSDRIIQDHYTGLMWCVPALGWRFWASAITEANNATNGGFINWALPVFNELSTIVYRGNGTALNYAPFNIIADWLNDSVEVRNNIWTCETPENNTGQYKGLFYCNGAVISAAGDFFFSRALEADTFRSLYVRTF